MGIGQIPENSAAAPRPEGIFCPVGRALDIIGDRWTLVLIRHLLIGPRGFQELRERTGIAPRVLSSRLRRLVGDGFVERDGDAPRAGYRVTQRGRSFEPIVTAIARWFFLHGLEDLDVDPERFSETSARSIIESLPFMLREDSSKGVDLTFELRLTGIGGGVWVVRIAEGRCTVRDGFAKQADVRYTAGARTWCGVALGLLDARAVYRCGAMTKEGGRQAMDDYFHQIAPTRRSGRAGKRTRKTARTAGRVGKATRRTPMTRRSTATRRQEK